jgi:hypothetical protein
VRGSARARADPRCCQETATGATARGASASRPPRRSSARNARGVHATPDRQPPDLLEAQGGGTGRALVRADDQEAAGNEPVAEAGEQPPGAPGLQVRDHHVAAEDEVERPGGHLGPEVGDPEDDALPEGRPYAVEVARRLERQVPPAHRELPQGARGEARAACARDHHRVGIRREEVETQARKRRRDRDSPEHGEAVGLLPGRAAGAPGAEGGVPPRLRARRQRGDEVGCQRLEHATVPPQAGDRDPEHRVEAGPLGRRALEERAVGIGPGEPELAHPPLHPLARRPAHPPVAGPPEAQPGEAPLQEADALGVGHDSLPRRA